MGYLDLVDRLAILRTYRASHVLVDLGWVELDLGSSPGWWAATVATYCLNRMVEHPKSKSTQPNCTTRCPTLYLSLTSKQKFRLSTVSL